jgi:hypothetical protein
MQTMGTISNHFTIYLGVGIHTVGKF